MCEERINQGMHILGRKTGSNLHQPTNFNEQLPHAFLWQLFVKVVFNE